MDKIKTKIEGLRSTGRATFTIEELEIMCLRRSCENRERDLRKLLETILEFESEVDKLSAKTTAELNRRPHVDGRWGFKDIQLNANKFKEKLNEMKEPPKNTKCDFTEGTERGFLRAWDKHLEGLIVFGQVMKEEVYYKKLGGVIHPQ